MKMAWKPLPSFRLAVVFVDVSHRFSSSVRRAATNNMLVSAFQGGHPILMQRGSVLDEGCLGVDDGWFCRELWWGIVMGVADGWFAESFGGR
ncbi:hypothetical protein V6N11_035096 [Hibiscus sabdariffa]|uniref:Secreted protein n=1 Tax=Hibiscus sabdariffa TaxID=183260 RepID=A0ABR2QZ62_9ROSI